MNGLTKLSDAQDEALAERPPSLQDDFDAAALRRIARLAHMITRAELRKAGKGQGPRWEDLPPETQKASERGVYRVVQALILTGWAEEP